MASTTPTPKPNQMSRPNSQQGAAVKPTTSSNKLPGLTPTTKSPTPPTPTPAQLPAPNSTVNGQEPTGPPNKKLRGVDGRQIPTPTNSPATNDKPITEERSPDGVSKPLNKNKKCIANIRNRISR